MNKMITKLAVTAALGLSLIGCATQKPPTPQLRADVTRFHQWSAAAKPAVTVVLDAGQKGSLEYQAYATQVSAALSAAGFPNAALDAKGMPAEGALVAKFNAAIQSTVKTIQVADSSGPYYPYWGTGFAPFYGHLGYAGGWGGHNSYRHGGWGGSAVFAIPIVAHPTYYSRNITVYQRAFSLVLETREGKRVFEAKVSSDGTNGNLSEIMPALAQAALRDFPGINGKSSVVMVALPKSEPAAEVKP